MEINEEDGCSVEGRLRFVPLVKEHEVCKFYTSAIDDTSPYLTVLLLDLVSLVFRSTAPAVT